MTRNLKTLGLALCAVLALTAVMASAASAAGKYTAASYPASGTATSAFGNDTFKTEAGTVECAGHFAGSLSEASSHLKVKATYTSCKFAAFNAVVDMNGCEYTFETPTGSGANWTAPVQIVCTPVGNKIAITVPAGGGTCEVQVGAQTPGGSVAITNNAGGDVSVKASVGTVGTSIAYTVTKDGFGCPFAGTGAKTGATYTQHTAITFDSAVNIHVG